MSGQIFRPQRSQSTDLDPAVSIRNDDYESVITDDGERDQVAGSAVRLHAQMRGCETQSRLLYDSGTNINSRQTQNSTPPPQQHTAQRHGGMSIPPPSHQPHLHPPHNTLSQSPYPKHGPGRPPLPPPSNLSSLHHDDQAGSLEIRAAMNNVASDIRTMRDVIERDVEQRSSDMKAIHAAISTFTSAIEKVASGVVGPRTNKRERQQGGCDDQATIIIEKNAQILHDYLKLDTCMELSDQSRWRMIYPPCIKDTDVGENSAQITMSHMKMDTTEEAVAYLGMEMDGKKCSIGIFMERGRGRALEFIRTGCLSAFIRNCPSASPLHRTMEDISAAEKAELRRVLGRDEYKTFSSYENAWKWAVRACVKEARGLAAATTRLLHRRNNQLDTPDLPSDPFNGEPDPSISVYVLGFISLKVRTCIYIFN